MKVQSSFSQSIPTESENLRTLLKCVACDATKTSQEFDLDQTCSDAVSSITDDVCRPLRTRVEQILLLEAGPIVLYKLVQLIRNVLLRFISLQS